MPPWIWPTTRLRVDRLADVLGACQLDHLDQAELDVDVDHRAVRGEGVLHVRVALAGLRVDRVGRPVPPLDGLLDGVVAEHLGQAGEHLAAPADDLAAVQPQVRGRAAERRSARASTAARTASQAAFTAPPVTYVCRDADVEPAEPTWCPSGGR